MNYTEHELRDMGIKFGENVAIHRSVELFGSENIEIGSNVRIDAFCLLSASKTSKIQIGNYVHLSAGVYLYGGDGIVIEDYAGISAKTCVFTASDDYHDGYMTNPMIPEIFKNTKRGKVLFKKHSIIGCGSVIMPGVEVGIGASVGAQSFVNKDVPDYFIVSGNPMRKIGERNKERLSQLELEHASYAKNTK